MIPETRDTYCGGVASLASPCCKKWMESLKQQKSSFLWVPKVFVIPKNIGKSIWSVAALAAPGYKEVDAKFEAANVQFALAAESFCDT